MTETPAATHRDRTVTPRLGREWNTTAKIVARNRNHVTLATAQSSKAPTASTSKPETPRTKCETTGR
ncbi:Uncharacterised protein [Mycobacterium tuberculosis]|nr:Uncharacterised protein [Mycobacterium tuberculosis]